LKYSIKQMVSSVDLDGSGTLTFAEAIPVVAYVSRSYPAYGPMWSSW
jgi:hypothetical protein